MGAGVSTWFSRHEAATSSALEVKFAASSVHDPTGGRAVPAHGVDDGVPRRAPARLARGRDARAGAGRLDAAARQPPAGHDVAVPRGGGGLARAGGLGPGPPGPRPGRRPGLTSRAAGLTSGRPATPTLGPGRPTRTPSSG